MATTVGTLEVIPTIHCASVYANFSGDAFGDNFALLEYRDSGGSWKPGMPLTSDRRAQVYGNGVLSANPFVNQWRGSIFGLLPNNNYDVRVTFTDPNGFTGPDIAYATVRTRADAPPPSVGRQLHVSPTGSDSGDGSEAYPWATLQHAFDMLQVGDTLYVHAGIYHEIPYMTKSGTADNPITITNYNGEEVIIDCDNFDIAAAAFSSPGGLKFYNPNIANHPGVSYVVLKGIHVVNAYHVPIMLVNAHYNWIDNIEVSDFGYGRDGGIMFGGRATDNVVQYTIIHSARNTNPDSLHRTSGICFTGWKISPPYVTWGDGFNSGNIIRYNRVYEENGGLSDCVGGQANHYLGDGPYKDCDIYENDFGPCMDDNLELEGGDICVRAFNNILRNPANFNIAHAPCVVGPLHCIGNIVLNPQRGNFEKNGCSNVKDGHVYMWNNSVYAPVGVGLSDISGGTYGRNIHYLNNAMLTWRNGILVGADGVTNHTFDFDCIGVNYTDPQHTFWAQWADTRFTAGLGLNIQPFRDLTGQETHGIEADPLFVNPAAENLSLAEGSPCIDKAVIIPGINDAGSLWAFKGNGPDIGAIESDYNAPPVPSYTINIAIMGQGTTVPVAGQYTAYEGDILDLSALPSSGWLFARWEENGQPLSTEQQISILANADRTITAVFEEIVVPLTAGFTANPVQGPAPLTVSFTNRSTGTIYSVLWDFGDGAASSEVNPTHVFASPGDYTVTLTVTGPGGSNSAAIQITASAPVISHVLTIEQSTGGVTSPSPGQYPYPEGQVVEVTAIPDAGYAFVGWQESGVVIGTANTISIVMDADRSIMAIFQEIILPPQQYAVTISVLGNGTTDPAPAAYPVNAGQTFSLTAIPAQGYKFDHWQGDLTGTQPTASFPVNANMSIVAVFVKKEPAGFFELLWDIAPFFPWEGPPLPRFTGWDWNHLPTLGGAA